MGKIYSSILAGSMIGISMQLSAECCLECCKREQIAIEVDHSKLSSSSRRTHTLEATAPRRANAEHVSKKEPRGLAYQYQERKEITQYEAVADEGASSCEVSDNSAPSHCTYSDPCSPPCFYSLACPTGFTLGGEFLYWYARETDLSYGIVVEGQSVTTLGTGESTFVSPQESLYLDSKWDPGFRVGMGWTSSCSGWDLYFSFTSMQNKNSKTTTVPSTSSQLPIQGARGIVNPWISGFAKINSNSFSDPELDGIFPLTFDQVIARFRLCWNMMDMQLGRKFWFCECFSLRPYLGLRGGWWKSHFQTQSTRLKEADTENPIGNTYNFLDQMKNDTWGVGLLGGFQPTWYFWTGLGIYGNFSGSLLWGDFKQKKEEAYVTTNFDQFGDQNPVFSYSNQTHGTHFLMTPVLDLSVGLEWATVWCGCLRTTLNAGWEHHIAFDQNHRFKSDNSFIEERSGQQDSAVVTAALNYEESHGNISLGGLVLRLRIDF